LAIINLTFQAQRILLEPDREFASSIFVKLEVLPKATYYKNAAEVAFDEEFFNLVNCRAFKLHRPKS